MFRRIAKLIVGKKPATMEWTTYRHAVRCVENTLRDWVSTALSIIIGVALMAGIAAMMIMALVAEEPGYYKPNPDGMTINGMPYHYHVTNDCDICE